MTIPQQQPQTRGQVLDRYRTPPRYGVWPAKLQTSTFTLSVYAAGTYSFKIDGVKVEYTAGGGDDANATIAGLLAKFQGLPLALGSAFPTIAAAPAPQNVLSLRQRSPGRDYKITDIVSPGGATFTFADTTVQRGRLGLGLAVAFVNDEADSLRVLAAGDTGAAVVGVTVEGFSVAENSLDPDDEDGYDPGDAVAYATKGLVPVPVEVEVTSLADPVYTRIIAPGDEELGAFRPDDDGASGNVVLLPNARWTMLSYLDNQARLTAEVRLNLV